AGRPGVRGEVRKGDGARVSSGREGERGRTGERWAGAVGRRVEGGLGGIALRAGGGGGGEPRKVFEGERDVERWGDAVARHAVGVVDAGAREFVANQEGVQAGVQGLGVECSLEVEGEGDVEEGGARRQLLDEPQALLRERQWQQRRAWLG
ncbi:hypothetical protein B1218_35545, partial [Pseudomonas ogarae]